MSSSIGPLSAVTVSALRTSPASAADLRAQAVAHMPIIDTVTLSAKARSMLAAAQDLQAFEARWQNELHGSSKDSLSTEISGGAGYGVFAQELDGHTYVNEIIRGSATADQILKIAINYGNRQPDTTVRANVILGDGNDVLTATTNVDTYISAGNGNDTIDVTTTGPDDYASIRVGSGNNTITLNGSGNVDVGSGTNVVNLHYTGGTIVSAAENRFGGTTVINGDGPGTVAYAGRGTTTINNVDQAAIAGRSGAVATINLDNEAYSQIKIYAGPSDDGGSATINLSDPAAGVRNDTHPYSWAKNGFVFKDGHRLAEVAADADGRFSGDYASYLDVVPNEGQAGYGLAHTRLDFVGVTANQVSSKLDGTKLTLTVAGTGQTVTVPNYQPGRITFTFAGADNSGNMTASREPPGLVV